MNKTLYNEIGPLGTPYQKGDWKYFAVHTDTEIKGFFGGYRFLSNFWPAQVKLDGVLYKSVELAYQSAKWKRGSDREYFQTCTSLESIDYNRKNVPNGYSSDEWVSIKVQIMKDLLSQKFDVIQNPELHTMLQNTGNKHLEEMNWWGDLFWGTDKDGKGENMLGKLLMEIRNIN